MKTTLQNIYYWLLLLLLWLPYQGMTRDHNALLPIFDASELHLIKSLSSKNYVNKSDESNQVSGNAVAIAFGKKLFFEKKLSGDHSMSCATCHHPDMAWANHKRITSLRANYPSSRHVPSLWGVKYNRWYFWDGRADSLWSQALQPIENIAEMKGSRVQVAQLIINTPALRSTYETLFGVIPASLLTTKFHQHTRPTPNKTQALDRQQGLTLSTPVQQHINHLFANIGKAIAAFEETLIADNTPFDQFANNLTPKTAQNGTYATQTMPIAAIRGLKLFIGKTGCINCHFGANFSDGEFHHLFLNPISLQGDLGRYKGIEQLLNDPFNANSPFSDKEKNIPKKIDYIYQNIEFRGQFKTPSLRNVATSYPYMHTGEFKTLTEVMEYYNTISKRISPNGHQEILLKSLHLTKEEINDLVEFLKSLTSNLNP